MRKTRNDSKFYYCLYSGEMHDIIDEYGHKTGDRITTYDEPVMMYANISPATGMAQEQTFGNLENYDKVIVTHDMTCPIDENTVLFIDKDPEFTECLTRNVIESETVLGEDEITPVTVNVPVFDYTVRRIARSLNEISIAVRKVDVS